MTAYEDRPVAPDSATVRNVPTGPARRGPTGIEPARIAAGQPGTDRGAATREGGRARIDGQGIYYKTLNEQIREEIERGATEVVLDNVNGQRYIGAGLAFPGVTLTINGVPGNDLAAFMDGPTLVVNDNAQDGMANTMNRAWSSSTATPATCSATACAAAGLRARQRGLPGGHPHEGLRGQPAGDRRGRPRARLLRRVHGGRRDRAAGSGGDGGRVVGSYVGTGMHAGVMYVRGEVAEHQLGKEVRIAEPDEADRARLRDIVTDYSRVMNLDPEPILEAPFVKIYPYTSRPYGRLYVY